MTTARSSGIRQLFLRMYRLRHRTLLVVLLPMLLCAACRQLSTTGGVESDETFLDDLQERTFSWFWETTSAETGLVPDRWPRRTFSSVAAIGFGLTAYGIGAERGYVRREEAAKRTLATMRFLWSAPQGTPESGTIGYRGFYYHFLEYETGLRYGNVELSTIDTALLMAGVLFAQSYFDRPAVEEAEIRALADSLFLRVEWNWFIPQSPLFTMAWYPDRGFGRAEYRGYNEAMILYVLALGSPTYPVEPSSWEAYTSTYEWGDYYGYDHLQFSPLFGHQYSHLWIDFRGIQDAPMREKGIDYFENSRRATLSQRAYAIANPLRWKGYGADVWGLTACDGPVNDTLIYNGETRRFHTYWARGASLNHVNDDGTLAPTALGGSVPFAPEETIRALRTIHDRYGEGVYGQYGFLDAFNPSFEFADIELEHGYVIPGLGWFDTDYLGIDQGPILGMIENYRSGLVWETMKKNPYLIRGLERAGFTGGWVDQAIERLRLETPVPAETTR